MSEVLCKPRFRAPTIIAKFVFLALAICLTGNAASAQIKVAVFGANSIQPFLDSQAGIAADLVDDAQIATPGFLDGYDVFLYTRTGSNFGTGLSVDAAANVRNFVTGIRVLFFTDLADTVGPGAAGGEVLLANELMLNAVNAASSGLGHGFIGELGGAGAALTTNTSGFVDALALGLVPGVFNSLTATSTLGWDILDPANPVVAGIPSPFNLANSQQFLVGTTGLPAGSVVAQGPDLGSLKYPAIVVYSPFSDSAGPVTSNVTANPNPASKNEQIRLAADIDDADSTVASANFEIRNTADGSVVLSGSGTGPICLSPSDLCPVDGLFDEMTESVQVTIPAGTISAGLYDACVSGTDSVANPGEFTCGMLVVYDPAEGFVTGQGRIDSPLGACQVGSGCEGVSGDARFGFVAKHKKDTAVPTGNAAFDFRVGDFKFESTSYAWLVVSGAVAQLKGSGTVNQAGDYEFLITVADSAVANGPADDTFRIRIVDKTTMLPVYDNDSGGSNPPLQSGDIKIHQ